MWGYDEQGGRVDIRHCIGLRLRIYDMELDQWLDCV